MLRHQILIRLFALAVLALGIYTTARQFAFEAFLSSLNITFDDFPVEYAKALNHSVALKKQPINFDYTSTFTNVTIPRTIHFIWFKNLYPSREGVTEMPTIGSRAPELCRKFNPNYDIWIWNATTAREFLTKEYAWFLPTYDGYKYPIQRVDALKYFVLWHYGGVYQDLDVSCRRPLDPLLEFPAWFPEASPLGVNNDVMAAAPRHPILKSMIDGLVTHNRNLIFPYLTIFWTTGPHLVSTILQEWYNNCSGRRCARQPGRGGLEPDTFVVLPRIFYSEKYTFFGHSPGGTWHGQDVAVVLWLVAHAWVLAIFSVTMIGTVVCLNKIRHIGSRHEKGPQYQLV